MLLKKNQKRWLDWNKIGEFICFVGNDLLECTKFIIST